MSFNITQINAVFPSGSICAYGDSIDPEGWVICDGILRTNTNNIYTNLANLGIGTLSNNNTEYTPPDLNSYTMIGKKTTTTLRNVVGQINNSVTLSSNQMPSHKHNYTITDHATHTHTYSDRRINDGQSSGDRQDFEDGKFADSDITRTTGSNSHGHNNAFSGNAGSATPISILNSSYIVNWIAKL